MKVDKFWNQAFLAALSRLPAHEAKIEADLATELCISHWQSHACDWAEPREILWQNQRITKIPFDTAKPR